MKIIVSCDSFKGTLSAEQACAAVAEGARSASPLFKPVCLPVADGGEGTVAAFYRAIGGQIKHKIVTGPYFDKVDAEYLLNGKTAVIESAQACGITLSTRRDGENATTYGVGELISAALDDGAEKLIIGLGGSATSDCGIGALSALGVRFLASDGREVAPTLAGIADIASIDSSQIDSRLASVECLLACDVTNPLCGINGAVYIYGGQKGIKQVDMPRYESLHAHIAEMICAATGKNIAAMPGAGAAGGLAAGLISFVNCSVKSGIECLLDGIDFDSVLADADLVVSGEGRVDSQTGCGKVISGIAAHTRSADKPLIVFAGDIGEGREVLYDLGVSAVFCIQKRPATFEEVLFAAYENLRDCAENVFRAVAACKTGL